MPDNRRQRQNLRETGLQARRLVAEPEVASRLILDRVIALREYRRSRTVLWYVSARAEVATHEHLRLALLSGKSIAVPYCVGRELRLFSLRDWSDLEPGAYGILEPRGKMRDNSDRAMEVSAIDFAIVPGVAFDTAGQRLGHGQGFYDRLLSECPETTTRCGICFESQIVQQIPHENHDVPMHLVVTEQAIYDFRGPQSF